GAPAEERASAPPRESPKRSDRPRRRLWRRLVTLLAVVAVLAIVSPFAVRWITTLLNTVSTDDAYINGHVTFVAARVPGQVSQVLVDDNYRVKKGDVLLRLDSEPYQVQVAIQRAAVGAAEANLAAAQAQVRGQLAQTRAARYRLLHAIEDVNNQVATLRASIATLTSRRASLKLTEANLRRGQQLVPSGAISKEEFDARREAAGVDEANVDQALQAVYAIRVSLGLPGKPPDGHSLEDVPPNLAQNFSLVRQAAGELVQTAAQYGFFPPIETATPEGILEIFREQDPEKNLERTFANAPAIKQANAALMQARRNLEQAELNLRYCDVVSETDGVVTRRNVNPGNNVQAGQSLMAVRSLTEIWVDANFKETQLADLRIGQRVVCEVDMYGGRREFEGRISGFTMGTGQTLALLPPQNATGNYVKIVQRLPVRIELTNYDPEKGPLFIGLSVVPYVYYKEPPTGPYAGEVLQPLTRLPEETPEPRIGQRPGSER
ncbi:MAG: HlyD family secretion protein, partial [Thermoguttaceae bacterium]